MSTKLLIIIESILKLFVITKRGVGGQKSNLPEVTKFAHIFFLGLPSVRHIIYFLFLYILILLLLCYFNIIVLLCYFNNMLFY